MVHSQSRLEMCGTRPESDPPRRRLPVSRLREKVVFRIEMVLGLKNVSPIQFYLRLKPHINQ
jgi:hypothetical protein